MNRASGILTPGLLFESVISKGLCTVCGACVGVCPGSALRINALVPELTGECDGCGACYAACPGKEIHLDRLEARVFGRVRHAHEKRIGIHAGCFAANCAEASIRENATSGGVITGLLAYAFDRGLIDGALITGIDSIHPLCPVPMLATGRKDLVAGQKSKYMLVSGGLLSILKEIVVEKGFRNIAVVGSPCHVHAVRKIQHSAVKFLKSSIGPAIKYCLGLFCAFNFFPEGTQTIIQALGFKPEDIESIDWRDTSETPFPGKFCARAKSGEKRSMDLLQEYIILGGIFDHPRCRLCYDWANELADISSGDEVDEMGFHRQGSKRSHTVVRSAAGRSLFDGAVSGGYLEAEKTSEERIARNLGFVIKKVGNMPRIEERRRLGLPLPEYGNYPFY
jgi:coenzyme F420 hydrogenase subunit beta